MTFEKVRCGFKVEDKRLKNIIFQSRDLCLRALDTDSLCAKNVRRNVVRNETGTDTMVESIKA